MDTKPWWRSKTILYNIGTIILAILGFLMVTEAAGGLPFHLDARWLVLISGIVNILLRFVSSVPVTVSRQ